MALAVHHIGAEKFLLHLTEFLGFRGFEFGFVYCCVFNAETYIHYSRRFELCFVEAVFHFFVWKVELLDEAINIFRTLNKFLTFFFSGWAHYINYGLNCLRFINIHFTLCFIALPHFIYFFYFLALFGVIYMLSLNWFILLFECLQTLSGVVIYFVVDNLLLLVIAKNTIEIRIFRIWRLM